MTETPQQRRARSLPRIRRTLGKYRLWTKYRGRWVEMTNTPIMWFANKRAGQMTAMAKR